MQQKIINKEISYGMSNINLNKELNTLGADGWMIADVMMPIYYGGSVMYTQKPGYYSNVLFCVLNKTDNFVKYRLVWKERGSTQPKDIENFSTEINEKNKYNYTLFKIISIFSITTNSDYHTSQGTVGYIMIFVKTELKADSKMLKNGFLNKNNVNNALTELSENIIKNKILKKSGNDITNEDLISVIYNTIIDFQKNEVSPDIELSEDKMFDFDDRYIKDIILSAEKGINPDVLISYKPFYQEADRFDDLTTDCFINIHIKNFIIFCLNLYKSINSKKLKFSEVMAFVYDVLDTHARFHYFVDKLTDKFSYKLYGKHDKGLEAMKKYYEKYRVVGTTERALIYPEEAMANFVMKEAFDKLISENPGLKSVSANLEKAFFLTELTGYSEYNKMTPDENFNGFQMIAGLLKDASSSGNINEITVENAKHAIYYGRNIISKEELTGFWYEILNEDYKRYRFI